MAYEILTVCQPRGEAMSEFRWIPFSERHPTKEDGLIIAAYISGHHPDPKIRCDYQVFEHLLVERGELHCGLQWPKPYVAGHKGYTHWTKCPPFPPVIEEAQPAEVKN